MADKPDWVRDFDRPRGTEIKHIRGHWYLYERSWRYDPEIKRSRKVSGRCLGKITPEGLVPSVSRAERARAAEAEVVARVEVSTVVEIGASTLVWDRTSEMRARLKRHFPDDWREIYALAYVRAVWEAPLRRSAAHLADSALSRAIGSPSLAPARVSSLLKSIGRDRASCCAYMRESVAHGSRFLLFDGHRLLTASRGCDLAELGYDSKVRHRPQVNLIYAFSMGEEHAEPVYYKRYSGGTTDVGAYPDVLEEAGMWGEDCIAVTDKGFSSEDDFAKLVALGLGYVSPPERNNRFAKDRIPEGPSGWEQAFTYNGRGICCMTLPQDGFVVHVYLDTELYYREFSDATARLEGREDAKAAKAEAERARREQGKGKLTDEQLTKLDPVSITDSLADRRAMGTITVRTNRTDLSAKTVYCILKQRQAVEQFFKTYDDTLDFEATWMRSDEAMEGLLFPDHLSATIAADLAEMIYDAGRSRDTSYRDCVEMAKKMRACRFADGGWQAVPPIKKRLPLYRELGMDPYDLRLLEMDHL